MKLYEMISDFNELNALLEDETQEVDTNTINEILEEINVNIDEKIGNISSLIKNKMALAKAIKEEETALKARRERAEKEVESLKCYLSEQMLQIGKMKYEDSRHKITFRKSTSVEIDEDLFPDELKVQEIKYKIPSKTELKAKLEDGEEIQGVKLVSKDNIQIK